jgi:hypothetical protein
MQQQQRLTEQERADLVAFLDGELDDDDSQNLETKISSSVSARREIEALEKTWSMLDWLPRLDAPADFAGQTVSRIHSQQLRSERIEGRVKQVAGVTGKTLAWALCAAAALVVGFVGMRYAWPDPTRELIGDLEIAQNLEMYRAVPDVKFLDDLSLLRFFEDAVVSPPSAEPVANPPADTAAELSGGPAPTQPE